MENNIFWMVFIFNLAYLLYNTNNQTSITSFYKIQPLKGLKGVKMENSFASIDFTRGGRGLKRQKHLIW